MMNEPEPQDQNVPETASTSTEEAAVDSDLAAMMEQVQKITLERNQLQDQVMRTMADFQNFRKRTQSEAALLRQFATESFVTTLLPVLDNFERTLAHAESGATAEAITEGIRAVGRQLKSALETQNVTRGPSVGAPFDPMIHEAIATVESEEHEDDTIVSEIEPGYKMGDKVIRPARVRVAKKS